MEPLIGHHHRDSWQYDRLTTRGWALYYGPPTISIMSALMYTEQPQLQGHGRGKYTCRKQSSDRIIKCHDWFKCAVGQISLLCGRNGRGLYKSCSKTKNYNTERLQIQRSEGFFFHVICSLITIIDIIYPWCSHIANPYSRPAKTWPSTWLLWARRTLIRDATRHIGLPLLGLVFADFSVEHNSNNSLKFVDFSLEPNL